MERKTCDGKASGRDFRNHLQSYVTHDAFELCLNIPSFQMRPEIKSDGNQHCKNVLIHSDNALVIRENPGYELTNERGKHFELKEESVGPPKTCVGGSIRKV